MTEGEALNAILNRADELAETIDWPDYTRLSMMMDITMVHQDCAKLDLQGLATARQGDFNHDVVGIWNHYNRVTGALEGGFVPRYAKDQS